MELYDRLPGWELCHRQLLQRHHQVRLSTTAKFHIRFGRPHRRNARRHQRTAIRHPRPRSQVSSDWGMSVPVAELLRRLRASDLARCSVRCRLHWFSILQPLLATQRDRCGKHSVRRHRQGQVHWATRHIWYNAARLWSSEGEVSEAIYPAHRVEYSDQQLDKIPSFRNGRR